MGPALLQAFNRHVSVTAGALTWQAPQGGMSGQRHTVVGNEVLAVRLIHLEAQQHGDVALLVERRHQRLARVWRIHGHHDVEVGAHTVEANGAFPLKAPAVGVVVPVPSGRFNGPVAAEQPLLTFCCKTREEGEAGT